MRRWPRTALSMLAAICWAHGAEATCDLRTGGGPFAAQWIEGGEMWGARLVAADAKWKLKPTWHATGTIVCETCDADQIRGAVFWFVPANPADRDVDKEVSPESFANMIMALHMPLGEYRASSDPKPVVIAGLEGKARKIGIQSSDGHSFEAIILFASRGCLDLTAIASARNGKEIPLDRIDALLSAIDIQRYGPRPDPCPPDPRAPEDIPLLEQLQPKPPCPAAADDGK